MKTLEQIKDDYIKSNFSEFTTWKEFQNYYANRHPDWFEQHWNEICILAQKEALKNASENARLCEVSMFGGQSFLGSPKFIDKTTILNENNIIK